MFWKKNYFTNFIINRPKLCLVLGLIFILLFIPGLNYFQTNYGPKIWFRANDPNIKVLENFENKFGSDATMSIVLQFSQSLFNKNNIEIIDAITQKMWELPDVIRVDSITNYYWSYADQDEIITDQFIPKDRFNDQSFLSSRQKEASDHLVLPNYLISKNNKTAVIYLRLLNRNSNELKTRKIYELANELIQKHRVEYHITGGAAINALFQKISNRDLFTLTPILFALIGIYLLITFRSLVSIVVPLITIFATIIVVIGLSGYLGIIVNSLTMITPSIITAIGIADSVHLLSTYYQSLSVENDKPKAALQSLNKNKWPIFLTSFSTSIGFFSLTISDIKPVSDLGLLAACGSMVAFLLTYLFIIPSLLVFENTKTNNFKKLKIISKSIVINYLNFLYKCRYIIICSFLLLSVFCIYKAFQNEINSNPFKYFTEDTAISKANRYVLKEFGGIGGPEIMIHSQKQDGIKEPIFLNKVDQFKNWLEAQSFVNKTISIIDIIKELNQSVHSGQKSYYTIPKTKKAVAQLLFMYNLSVPEGSNINDLVDLQNESIRLRLLWSLQDAKSAIEKSKVIEDKAKSLGLNIDITGKSLLFQKLNSYIVDTFFSSMAYALALITTLLIFIFKNIKIGLLSLIPNFIPICVGAAYLSISHTPIDIGCAIVAAITLGIAVDDTIHFLNHYKMLLEQNRDLSSFEIMTEVISKTGLSLIITTLILVSGFGLFIFAHLVPNINFGKLCAIVLFIALFCDLVILPVILFIQDDFKLKTL